MRSSCARCARLLAEVERLDSALRSVAAESEERNESAIWPEADRGCAGGRVSRDESGSEAPKSNGMAGGRRGGGSGLVTYFGLGVAAFCAGVLEPAAGAVPVRRTPVRSWSTQQADAVVAENEDGARFIRLPYAGDGRAVEDDAIVRAVLPRSALASLGFPVGDVNGTESVPVELMVSEDGTPEAIRLVSQDIEE